MIRILIFLLSIVFLASAITYFASLDSRITGEAFGYKFDGPSGLILGGLFIAFLIAIYLTHFIKNVMALPAKLMALPAKLKAQEKETRLNRGIAALTRGLESVAVGDAADAAHHAKVARRHLDDMALTRLLSAQAAQLSGDETAARESFSAMLEAPETEFLGLKGLYLQSMAKGDHHAARDYAERAFRLRPNARWAFESVFDLGLDRGAWRETREAVDKARRNGVLSADKADRAKAALLTADAYAASLSGDAKEALSEAEAAIKLAPGLTPASLLAAQLCANDGKPGKAAKIIEAAFTAAAHPALPKFYDHLYKDEQPEKRADKLRKLAQKNETAIEAALMKARAHNLLGEWKESIAVLEPVLTETPTASAFSLMAQAAKGLHGEAAARPWLERAANAPRDPRPGAEGEFHFTRDGWARLVREFMDHGRLAPPPLEDTAQAISAEEVRLLLAPPEPSPEPPQQDAEREPQSMAEDEAASVEKETSPPEDDDGEHVHSDEEAERIAAAAREVS